MADRRIDRADAIAARRVSEGLAFFAGFALSIPAANWLIGHVGTMCAANGPCVIPVAPGIMAPSGVLMVGLALVLRDLVQRGLGVAWSTAAIFAGAALALELLDRITELQSRLP